jgi:hypothetical protein
MSNMMHEFQSCSITHGENVGSTVSYTEIEEVGVSRNGSCIDLLREMVEPLKVASRSEERKTRGEFSASLLGWELKDGSHSMTRDPICGSKGHFQMNNTAIDAYHRDLVDTSSCIWPCVTAGVRLLAY